MSEVNETEVQQPVENTRLFMDIGSIVRHGVWFDRIPQDVFERLTAIANNHLSAIAKELDELLVPYLMTEAELKVWCQANGDTQEGQ